MQLLAFLAMNVLLGRLKNRRREHRSSYAKSVQQLFTVLAGNNKTNPPQNAFDGSLMRLSTPRCKSISISCWCTLGRTECSSRPTFREAFSKCRENTFDSAAFMLTSYQCRGVHGDPVGIPWSNNQQEQHSVEFFINHSSSQLAGYFDSPFWQRIVLQAGQHEPSVRHAIVAIGALHEKLLTGTVNLGQSHDRRTQFALEQCNKSIQHLVKPNVCPSFGLPWCHIY